MATYFGPSDHHLDILQKLNSDTMHAPKLGFCKMSPLKQELTK